MTVFESKLRKHVKDTLTLDIGTLHFLDKIAIIEFKLGVHLTMDNTKHLFETIDSYFNSQHFGLISNRINSYSIQPLDMKRTKDAYENFKFYASVSTDKASKMNGEIENSFCPNLKISFDNLYEAVETIHQRLSQLPNNSIAS